MLEQSLLGIVYPWSYMLTDKSDNAVSDYAASRMVFLKLRKVINGAYQASWRGWTVAGHLFIPSLFPYFIMYC